MQVSGDTCASYLRKQMLHVVERKRNNASSEKARLQELMKHFAALPQNMKRTYRCMKRHTACHEAQPFQASFFFAFQAKKWRSRLDSNQRPTA